MLAGWVFSARTYVRALSPWRRGPKERFIVFGQGRTGSTLLQKLLDAHPKIQCDGELLYYPRWRPWAFVEGCARSSSAQVYGFKVKPYQLDRNGGHAMGRSFLKRAISEGWRLICLRRENLFRHALSGLVANRRGQVWHSAKDHKLERVELSPRVVLNAINRRLEYREAEVAAVRRTGLPRSPVRTRPAHRRRPAFDGESDLRFPGIAAVLRRCSDEADGPERIDRNPQKR